METIMTKDSYLSDEALFDLEAAQKAYAATPKPDSPVCVEARELEWEHHPENEEYNEMWFADMPSGLATIIRDEGKFHIVVAGHKFKPKPDLPSAQSACQAVMTDLVAELVNARSVESVRAEAMRETPEDRRGALASTIVEFLWRNRRVLQMDGLDIADFIDEHIPAAEMKDWLELSPHLRSLTEGEG
jgi:hypothetical protein